MRYKLATISFAFSILAFYIGRKTAHFHLEFMKSTKQEILQKLTKIEKRVDKIDANKFLDQDLVYVYKETQKLVGEIDSNELNSVRYIEVFKTIDKLKTEALKKWVDTNSYNPEDDLSYDTTDLSDSSIGEFNKSHTYISTDSLSNFTNNERINRFK